MLSAVRENTCRQWTNARSSAPPGKENICYRTACVVCRAAINLSDNYGQGDVLFKTIKRQTENKGNTKSKYFLKLGIPTEYCQETQATKMERIQSGRRISFPGKSRLCIFASGHAALQGSEGYIKAIKTKISKKSTQKRRKGDGYFASDRRA